MRAAGTGAAGATAALADDGAGRAPHPPADLRRAVFLDKDGTLVEDVPYNVDPARVVFTHEALPALRRLADAGFALVVVSNQPGIALGRFTRADFAALRHAVERRVAAEAGVEFLDWFACPHAPGADAAPACLCRKPAPGMLRQAARLHGIDLARSWMVGDILDDVEAGKRVGCRSVLLDVGHETLWRMSPLRQPDLRCADLHAAARAICAAVPA